MKRKKIYYALPFNVSLSIGGLPYDQSNQAEHPTGSTGRDVAVHAENIGSSYSRLAREGQSA